MRPLSFLVVCLFAVQAIAAPNYREMAGPSDRARNEAIKLGTLPVTTKTKTVTYSKTADYMQLLAINQPTASVNCPNGQCPYQQPIRQMIRQQPQATYYTQAEDPGYLPPGDEVPCGAEAYTYAAADDSPCGSSTYAQANAETACGSAAYSTASARRQSRWERRKARREARAQATARAGVRPLRRLLGRC